MEHHELIAGTTVEAVHAQVVSRDFLVAFGEELGVTTKSATLGGEGAVQQAVLVWTFSTAKPGIPSLARKFLSDEVELTWDQTWSLGTTAAFDGALLVTLDGRPGATSTGRSTLTATEDGVELVTDTSTRTTLPRLVGAGIEATIDKELVGWILAVQSRVLRRRLAGD